MASIYKHRNGWQACANVLKEMALLKHALNMAIREWNWSSFKNPLLGMKLPTPAPPRDRVFASDEEQRLRKAMEECDNPFILPLFDFAIETTARRGSLFKLEWCDVDFERRYAMLYDTKGGHNVPVPLTLRAIEILKRLPRDAGKTKVFPITISALKSARARVCVRAGIENLHFQLANSVKESLPSVLPIEDIDDVISAPAKKPSPAAVIVADPALVSLGSNVIRFPSRRAA
jgi:integrase